MLQVDAVNESTTVTTAPAATSAHATKDCPTSIATLRVIPASPKAASIASPIASERLNEISGMRDEVGVYASAVNLHLTQDELRFDLGEQLGNRFEFWNYVVAEAVDVVQPNVWKVGGITEWLKIAHLAQHANLPIAPHDSLELSRHLVAGVANGFMVENIFGGNLSDLGVVEEPVAIAGGRTRLPETPGHGVVFREDMLARYALKPGEIVRREPSVHGGL